MGLSRRSFFRNVGVAAVAGVAAESAIAYGLPAHRERTEAVDADAIFLDCNENPYGPSEKVRTAMAAALKRANRYPDRQYQELIEAIAGLHQIWPEQVVLGCGSTEILRASTSAFLTTDAQLVQATPTYSAVESYARSRSARVVSVPLTREFAHDLNAMQRYAAQAASLIYICNPNNPTASLTPRRALDAFIADLPRNSRVVIDEAYHHYAGRSANYQSFVDHPADERVIVTRTFSAAYGLAGLRIGYGVAHPDVAKQLRLHLTLESINQVAVAAAIAAVNDGEGLKSAVSRNADDRQEFFNQAQARMLKPVDSHANFWFMDVHLPAKDVAQRFAEKKIWIDGSAEPPFGTYIRVSLGDHPEMVAFWRAWDGMPHATGPMEH